MSKKSQEHPYIPALNGEVLRTKHHKVRLTKPQIETILQNRSHALRGNAACTAPAVHDVERHLSVPTPECGKDTLGIKSRNIQ
jgi:hypothetical protein